MRELFTNVIVNIQQAVMLNIDKISDVSVKVYDLKKMLHRTDYAVAHNTDAIETVESSVEAAVHMFEGIESDLLTIKQEAHHAKLANAEEFNKLLNSISSTDVLLEALTERFDELEDRMASVSAVHDLGVDIRDMTTKYNNIRRSHDEQYSNLIARICAIEKNIVKLGAYDDQDINTPAAVEMDRLDEELSKFIVDEFNK